VFGDDVPTVSTLPMNRITSVDNPLIKRLRRLHDVRHRRTDGTFLVEGQRAIAAFLVHGWRPRELLIGDGLSEPAEWAGLAAVRVSSGVLDKLSLADTPSGYLASFALPAPAALDPAAGGLVLHGIADPGNLGTLIRCAAAFAVRQVLLVGGTDPFAYKVVQASAGELAAIALHRVEPAQGLKPLAGGAPCCALVVRGGSDPTDLPRRPRWLVVGSEAHGLDEAALAACAERVTLPMPGGTESLNAAMAGAIACYALFAARRS
jgi:RNA methyltransferase, TrmH family